MKSMTLMMPLMSIWICFVMPAAMGIYWIANSVFGIIRDFALTKVFKKQLDAEMAERAAARSEREKELEAKRLETERLKAEGKTTMNTNTSKKKIQANEKQKSDERKAALDKAERAARRERRGEKEYEKPASQVGDRRYARGRAYDPNRFSATAALDEGEPLPVEDAAESVTEPAAEPVVESVAEPVVEPAAEAAPQAENLD